MSEIENPIVIVKWSDAFFRQGSYYGNDKDYTPYILESVGYLMEQNEETVVLCSDYSPEDECYRHIASIPLVNVISITELVGGR